MDDVSNRSGSIGFNTRDYHCLKFSLWVLLFFFPFFFFSFLYFFIPNQPDVTWTTKMKISYTINYTQNIHLTTKCYYKSVYINGPVLATSSLPTSAIFFPLVHKESVDMIMFCNYEREGWGQLKFVGAQNECPQSPD